MKLTTFLQSATNTTIVSFFSDEEQAIIRQSKNPVSKSLAIVKLRYRKDTGDTPKLMPIPGVALTGI